MKGDFSRLPFQADIETKHYGAVLDQQGRVKTDYDKTAEVAIESHLRRHALRDIIGRSGAPADNAGFRLSRTPQGDLIIGAGDYYVDGILCTNDRDVSFTNQPDLPGQEAGDHDAEAEIEGAVQVAEKTTRSLFTRGFADARNDKRQQDQQDLAYDAHLLEPSSAITVTDSATTA